MWFMWTGVAFARDLPGACGAYESAAGDGPAQWQQKLEALDRAQAQNACPDTRSDLVGRLAAAAPAVDPEAVAFENARRAGTREAYTGFLALFKGGAHEAEARRWLAEHPAPVAPPPALAPAPAPAPAPKPVAPLPAPRPAPRAPAAGTRVDPVLGTLRWIPGGTYTMGSPDNEPGRDSDEGPQHQVRVSGFWLMETEVTQAMWEEVMGSNPSAHRDCPKCPVERVSWTEATEFARRVGARLPTEAEWEYAARGGEPYVYAGSATLSEVGWYDGNSGGRTHEVCGLRRNGYGLCDMSGNVWEWCSDWKAPYTSAAVTNPQGPTTGSYRVFRGGSFRDSARFARVAFRNAWVPGARDGSLGLRLARSE